MTPLAVFLHTVLVVALGPVLSGLIRMAASGGGLKALVEPTRAVSAGLRASGQPPLGKLAVLSLAVVAGLLIPLFSSDAVLGFLGDGFTALLLLTGLSLGRLPLRLSTVLAVAASLWAMGTLTGSTDLAQALANWEAGPATLLITIGLALSVAPVMTPEDLPRADLSDAVEAWTRGTLRLGWLAFSMMAFPVTIPLTGGLTFAAALAVFLAKFGIFGTLFAPFPIRWPKMPLAEVGLACSLLALGLAKLGI